MRGAGRPASLAAFGDARDHVVADRPLVGHPEDGAGGVLTGDAQHRGPERREQDRHRRWRRPRPSGCAREKPSFSTSTGPGPANGRVQHLEVVPHEVGRPLVREAELVARRSSGATARGRARTGRRTPPAWSAPAAPSEWDAGSGSGTTAVPSLDAVGRLADERDRGHGVEVAGDLRDPEGGEAGAARRPGRRRPGPASRSARARSLSEPIINPMRIGISLSRNIAIPLVGDDRMERRREERFDTR